MSFEYFIGGRYLRAKQKQAFVSLITILSIAGVISQS
jgi:lipoprotein-releasing system permease protein